MGMGGKRGSQKNCEGGVDGYTFPRPDHHILRRAMRPKQRVDRFARPRGVL